MACPWITLHDAEALESFFKTVCRLCWLLATAKPAVHQGTGRKGAWKIYGQAINGISEFSGKFSRNGDKMLCFHVLVGRLAVVIPCRLMTITFPRSLALSDSTSIFKTC